MIIGRKASGAALMLALVSAPALTAEQFDLVTPAGAIHVESVVALDDTGHAHLVATATNASLTPIKKAKMCVHVEGFSQRCLFTFWSSQEWAAGATIKADIESKVRARSRSDELIAAHTVTVESIFQEAAATSSQSPATVSAASSPAQPPRFDGVVRVYVDQIAGSNGTLAREQLAAALANYSRFQEVES
jgi:hypothetical protein